MNRTRTLRGTVAAGDVKQLIQADGNLNQGYRVLAFYAWPTTATAASDWSLVLAMDYDSVSTMDAGDNRQIGWMFSGSSAFNFDRAGVLDPEHIVIEDLYALNTSSPSLTLNYLVVLQEMELSDVQSVTQLIKKRSQDDER